MSTTLRQLFGRKSMTTDPEGADFSHFPHFRVVVRPLNEAIDFYITNRLNGYETPDKAIGDRWLMYHTSALITDGIVYDDEYRDFTFGQFKPDIISNAVTVTKGGSYRVTVGNASFIVFTESIAPEYRTNSNWG